MKSQERQPETMPQKPCVVCGDKCLPYGYTNNWGNLCSKKCSDKYDETRYQKDLFIEQAGAQVSRGK